MTVIVSVVPSRKGSVLPAWDSQCVLPPTPVERVAPFRHALFMATKWVAINCTIEGRPFKEQALEEYFKFRRLLLEGYEVAFSWSRVGEQTLTFPGGQDSFLADVLDQCGLADNLAWPAGYTAIRVTRREQKARVELLKKPRRFQDQESVLYYSSRLG